MPDMYAQYHSACPGLDTKTKGHRHSNRCRKITIVLVTRPWNDEAMAQVVVAFVLDELNKNKITMEAGRHTVRVDDATAAHIDVEPRAPSSDLAPTELPPPAGSDPSDTGEQLQLGL